MNSLKPQSHSTKRRFNVEVIRNDFPIFKRIFNGKPLVYLDNAATSQKPIQVLKAIEYFYTHNNANVKRGVHFLGEEATILYEQARSKVAHFLGAHKSHEIIFTRNITESINLVAYSWARTFLKKGDEILLTKMEHHSNLVPWRIIADEKEFTIKYIDVDAQGKLVLDELDALLTEKTKLVAVVYISNTLGTINDVQTIIKKAHRIGAKVLIDAAQAAPHIPINVQELDCDFLGITGHKMLGPTGIGALYMKEKIADEMPPFQGGGEMIQEVFLDHYIPGQIPEKFEAGTPPIAEAVSLKAAIEYMESVDVEERIAYERELTSYLLEQLTMLPHTNIIGLKTTENRIGNISFTVDGIHAHDLSDLLNEDAVCTRSGHHCTQPLMDHFGIAATTRASLFFYNTKEEIDALIRGIEKAYKIFHT